MIEKRNIWSLLLIITIGSESPFLKRMCIIIVEIMEGKANSYTNLLI